MKNALLLLGHADPQSLNAAIAQRYEQGWKAQGGTIQTIVLADLEFDPVLRGGHHKEQPLEPALVRLKAAIEGASHVVWVFPTYWASPPAIVRAVIDRLFLPGWAFRYRKGNGLPDKLLAGRSARVLTTMDSPSWWYSLYYYRAIHGAFSNGTLAFCGFSPVQTSVLYNTRARDENERRAWLDRVAHFAAQDFSATKALAPSVESRRRDYVLP